MADVKRVSAGNVQPRITSGTALLVCAYDSDEKFNANHLDGAIPLSEFKVRVPDLARDTHIIFY